MIDYMYLENFKGIQKQKFEFRKINIVCGPNNSGKSTVLSALNLICQSLLDNPTEAPLVLNGRHDELGTFLDLVYGHSSRSKIVIELGVHPYVYRYEFKYRPQRREIELVHYSLQYGGREVYLYQEKTKSFVVKYYGADAEVLLGHGKKRRPSCRGLRVVDRVAGRMPARAHRSHTRDFFIDDIADDESLKILHEVYHHTRRSFLKLLGTFHNFDSLGAFRERPKRTYLFSGESPSEIGRAGGSAIDILVSDSSIRGNENRQLVQKISHWFSKNGMAERIEIKPLTTRHYEVCVSGKDGKSHNLCDVGFGCSQVLPVLVAAYSFAAKAGNGGSVLIIQEPEIHLHPNAQAELGSLFADVCSEHGQIFLETHSPYLIIRLQTEIAKERVLAGDLKILYAISTNGISEFHDLKVDDFGIFEGDWPEGFFPQRHQETLSLAKASSLARKQK